MKQWTMAEQRQFQAKQVMLASIRAFVEELAQLDSEEAAEMVEELAARLHRTRDGN